MHAREMTFVLVITLQPTMFKIPFKYSQRKFHVKLVLVMTINKSQGPSIKYVGLDFQTPIFSHG
jgi:hypothetical protein